MRRHRNWGVRSSQDLDRTPQLLNLPAYYLLGCGVGQFVRQDILIKEFRE